MCTQRAVFLTAVCFSVFAGLGCGHAPPPSPCTGPEPIAVSLLARPKVNPDDAGQSLSTVVRLYMLKSKAKLEAAGMDELLARDRDALADDLLSVVEVTLNPNDRAQRMLPRPPEARYVAAVGLFRNASGTAWRAIARLPARDPDHCRRQTPARVSFVLEDSRLESR